MLEFQPLPLAKVTRPLLHNKKMIKQSLCQLLPINKPVQKGGSLWTVLSVLLYLSWPISQRTLSQSGSTSTNHDKTKMSLYGNTATFFGAADRIRTCGLSGRSSQTHRAKRLCEAVFRRLCTKFKTIQNAREAFSEPASRAFAYVVVKWWSQ